MKNVNYRSKFHDKRPFLPFFAMDGKLWVRKKFYSYLVPEMIWWKFHENRMLGSAKTKLPSLLWPAEWKEPAPFNCTRTAHTEEHPEYLLLTQGNFSKQDLISALPVMIKSSNLWSLCDYLSSLINVSNFSNQHQSKLILGWAVGTVLVEVTLVRVWPPHPEVQSQIFRLVFWGVRYNKKPKRWAKKSKEIWENRKEYERIRKE